MFVNIETLRNKVRLIQQLTALDERDCIRLSYTNCSIWQG